MRHYIVNYIENGIRKSEHYNNLREAIETFNMLDVQGKMAAIYNLV